MMPNDKPKPLPDDGAARLALFREHLTAGDALLVEYENDHGALLVDTFTLSMVVQLADALNEENRARLLGEDLAVMVHLGWKVVGGAA